MISPGILNSLQVAYRGLQAAQVGLDVVNHNISNANTEGYSRQRVTFTTSPAYTSPTIGRALGGGQIGMGVQLQGVNRIKNQYFDTQIQIHTGVNTFHTEYADALSQLEDIMSATSGNSINDDVQSFFNSLQELSLNPESIPARNAVLQQAEQMITQFQTKGRLIADLQKSLVGDASNASSIANSKLATMVSQTNSNLTELAALNGEITTITASGGTPNDLYDKRDKLLGALAQYVDFNATFSPSGVVDITIAGQKMVSGRVLSNTLEVVANAGPTPDPNYEPSIVRTVTGSFDILNNASPNTLTSGGIKALVDVAGGNTSESNLRGALVNLDTMLRTIATQINTLQTGGRDLAGNAVTDNFFLPQPPSATALEIFNYRVNPTVKADPTLIAAAGGGTFLGPGDGSNALAMAQLATTSMSALSGNTFLGYFNAISSKLGVDNNAHTNRADNSGDILTNLEQSRQQVSGVNMEEEMVNLVQYQRSFEASSRVIQTMNQLMQTILDMV